MKWNNLGGSAPKGPRMVCVQADGCAPLVAAFEKGEEFADPFPNPHTLAAGMRVPAAIGDFLVIRAVRESGGTAVTVTDEEMVDGMVENGQNGRSVRGSRGRRDISRIAKANRTRSSFSR